jgi:hypothetical protein
MVLYEIEYYHGFKRAADQVSYHVTSDYLAL